MMDEGRIKYKILIRGEPLHLIMLKSEFNTYALKLNEIGKDLSKGEIDELLDKINELENLIKIYEP